MKIFKKKPEEEEEFIDMVGMEDRKSLVVLTWEPDLSYFCVGNPRVGLVKAEPETR